MTGIQIRESEATITNSVFTSNTVDVLLSLGGDSAGEYEVYNNTFYDNNPGSTGETYLLTMIHSDFQNNIVSESDHSYVVYYELDSAGYNLFWHTGTNRGAGSGAISGDPSFTDAAAGDLSLRAGYSPAIDAGNPDARFEDVDGSRCDLGAYGGPEGSGW